MTLEGKLLLRFSALTVVACVLNALLASPHGRWVAMGLLLAGLGTVAMAIVHFAFLKPIRAARLAAEAHVAAIEELRLSDRIATLGQLAASVAQELGNPLNVVELRARLIMAERAHEHAQEHAVEIVAQVRRMTRVIDELRAFAHVEPAPVASLDLVSVLRKAIALSEHTSKKHKTSISLDVPETALEVSGNADRLLHIVLNLVINGVQAMPTGGTLRVRAREQLRSPIDDPHGTPRTYVCIAVTDHGAGVPDELVPKMFEPFFWTRNTNGGTGLGLAVAQGIAREHDGWISFENALGRGSTFKVHLPKHGPRERSDRQASALTEG